MNNDFESVWANYKNHDFVNFIEEMLENGCDVGKGVAEYFYNAGIASTKRKPEQIPALFKPKENK